MLQTVDVGNRSLSAYRGVALDATLDELVSAAEPLRDLRVLHLSATPYGGGVAELLRSLVPLLNDLGLAVDWRVISGDESFFKVTKQVHDALQGADTEISDEERATYQAVSEKNAAELTDEYDVVVVHDPQPAGIRQVHGAGDARWIWRCHIDTSEPSPEAWDFLRPLLADYDAAVYTMDAFLPPDLPVPHGFGLVVSEALWKGTPVVAGRAGGIPLQMADGAGGVLVESVEECATAVAELLADRERAQALGEAGRERVRRHFLLPRLLLNEVGLLATIAERRPPGAEEWRDPVCGIVLAEPTGGTEDVEGTRWGFCSERCRKRFRESPERYAPPFASRSLG
jgi:YHS domain-containing protein